LKSAEIKNGELVLKVTPVFRKNQRSGARIVVNQGSTGSSKTYSIIQNEIIYRMNTKGLTSIAAPTMPHLKKGAMKDFVDILTSWGMYDERKHHKTDSYYDFDKGRRFEFFALDDAGKARGPRRDRLYINECNMVDYNIFHQLVQRTRGKTTIDYNPADSEHWIYEKVIPRDDAELIISTYKDNPYLSDGEVVEIEKQVPVYKIADGQELTDWDLSFTDSGAKGGFLVSGDPNNWRVYGLGQRGVSEENIYVSSEIVDEFPEGIGETVYGLDFGFNVPSALVEVGMVGNKLYWRELFYEPAHTTNDLIEVFGEMGINKNKMMFCDTAEPDRIDELYKAGFNAHPSDKAVEAGIDFIKGCRLCITRESKNLIKEKNGYKWKTDKLGNRIDEPVKKNDHALDAARYASYTFFGKMGEIGFW